MVLLQRILLVFLLVVCLSCKENSVSKDDYPIMGNLVLGEHQVGFKTIFTYDLTRPGLVVVNDQNKIQGQLPVPEGRQHQISIWYPAVGSGTPAMTFKDYVHLLGLRDNFAQSSNEALGQQIFIDKTNDLGGNGNFKSENLEKLMALAIRAKKNDTPLTGQFPVVLMPHNTNPAMHSITAEFLASHGYVVVGFAPKGRYSSQFEVSILGFDMAVDDLEFVLSQIIKEPYVDQQNIGFIANGVLSSVGALAASKNPKLKLLVSLEGGLPSAFEQRLLSMSPHFEPHNYKLPTLFIYAPHPNISPQHVVKLKYADRYFAHFPFMSEYRMLNYGMFESFVPNIIGKYEGDTKKGFEVVNELMLRFLDIHMKDNGNPLFDKEFLNASEGVVDTTFMWAAVPSPPNLAEMKDLFWQQGFNVVDSIYHALQNNGNDQPFSQSFYSSFGMWLGWGNDPEYEDRLRLYSLAYDSYPQSASINYYFGVYLQRNARLEEAKRHYRKAISLLPTAEDMLLSNTEANRLRLRSEHALENLK